MPTSGGPNGALDRTILDSGKFIRLFQSLTGIPSPLSRIAGRAQHARTGPGIAKVGLTVASLTTNCVSNCDAVWATAMITRRGTSQIVAQYQHHHDIGGRGPGGDTVLLSLRHRHDATGPSGGRSWPALPARESVEQVL